ncbi:MAG: ABC transporter substrate-binding protein [Chloroflexi bacterium]|nr:ABC transporter substrate-binding protein [Chloroflexota bacterium]
MPSGTLTVASPAAPPHLDVHQAVSEALASLGPGLAYSRLLRLATGPEVAIPSMQVECDLCQSWRMVDPRIFEFTLRPEAQWHPVPPVNGRQVTAQDVVFSYQRLSTPGWPNAGLVHGVEGWTAVDERTVRVVLQHPDADFLRSLADGHAKIVAPEVVQQYGDLKEAPVVGTGPWVWEGKPAVGDSSFVASSAYFEPGVPGVQRLVIRVMPDTQTIFAALATGAVDVGRVEAGRWDTLKGLGVKSVVAPRMGTGALLALSAALEERVRVAFFLSLDPWRSLEDVWGGQGIVGLGAPVAQSDWLLSREEMGRSFNQPERARGMLAEVAGGGPPPLELLVADFGEPYLAYGEAVREQLARTGFHVRLQVVNRREYAERVWGRRDFQAVIGAVPPASTTNGFLLSMLHSQGQWSITGHGYQRLDQLVEEQAAEYDQARRGELVREVQSFVLDRGLLFMPAVSVERWAFWPQVGGFYPNLAGSEYSFWARVRVAG